MPDIAVDELRIDTDRGRLYAKRWNPARGHDDAPIVLFHDSLGCVQLWRDWPERLAAASGREVIAYDRLGFGRSDPHPGRLAADFVHDEAERDFRRVCDALALCEFVAFGHSVGGGMAIACAARWPQQCRALITVSAQAFVEDRTLDGIRAAREAFARPGELERLRKYHGDQAAWVLGAWIDTWLAPDFADWNLDEALHRVVCPTLAVHGDQDEYGSPAQPQRIAAQVRGPSTLMLLPGIGHVPQRERPELADDIARWPGLDRGLRNETPN
ncbi:alpha/beta hydrolase [Lysobacter sp. BMK333-48F3]|uniref:alpha/beta fold hydrolase n=1 Tax=Lysobacter sp. BMK333-48F3 TaxID=2867962 RepID=UPI001C8BD413|nr:alpha/beta hydrolase [Lysobacter sp. BMK333-48F3]MBX9400535.1 alpha/beta hydrolase [Lysobacter sp. BMK333-48F3]